MKCATLLLLFLCFASSAIQAEEPAGIRFFSGSWQSVLAESRRLNKPIYVDFYTSWCPPCRRMAREAFPNATIGLKFNESFINYQVDAEVGEGVTLARRYAVASYPTALYIIPTGELVHRAVGYAGVNAMLQQADMVLSMREVRRARRRKVNSADISPVNLPAQPDTTKADSISR